MSDNEGRRKGIRDWMTHDPLYKRLKDAMLLILALKLGIFSNTGLDLNWIFDGKKNDSKVETRDRSEARESFIKRMDRIEDKVNNLDKKMDSLLIALAQRR